MIWVIAATLIYGVLSAATPADGGIYFHLLCDCIFLFNQFTDGPYNCNQSGMATVGSLRHLPPDSVGIILKGFSVEELRGLVGTNRFILDLAKQELHRRQEQELQSLTDTLSALMSVRDDQQRCLWPQWDSEREITHNLDGFVGPIESMIAHSMNTSPARYPTFQLGVLNLKQLLNEYTSRWGFNLAPRHRRRRSPQWTR